MKRRLLNFMTVPSLVLYAAALPGCRHPIDVQVVSACGGGPVAGARVRRMDLKRPYFIVGPFRAVETRLTDAAGVARMQDRQGFLLINAEGYEPGKAGSDETRRPVRVLLKPLR